MRSTVLWPCLLLFAAVLAFCHPRFEIADAPHRPSLLSARTKTVPAANPPHRPLSLDYATLLNSKAAADLLQGINQATAIWELFYPKLETNLTDSALGWVAREIDWIQERHKVMVDSTPISAPDRRRSIYICEDGPAVPPWPLRLFGEPGYHGLFIKYKESDPNTSRIRRLFPEAWVVATLDETGP